MAERFLISRLSSLGDVACSLPAACALKSTWPSCEITWIVDPRFAGVVECCRAVDIVVRAKHGFQPMSWLKLAGEFEAALDLQGLLKCAIPVARVRAHRRVGYHWQRDGAWWCSDRVLPDPSSFHIVDQYVDVARAIGAEADRAEFCLTPKADELASVRSKLDGHGIDRDIFIVNPGAAWITKRWAPDRFARICDAVSESGHIAVLIGSNSKADQAVASQVSSLASRPIANLCGQTSVRELIALISLARAHLGGDTGSTHLAAALGIPSIGLYSLTRPARSCPYGQAHRCHYDPESLSNIQAESVLNSVMEALN
jgi:ADP-heptose:LPS heptosyltransferase